MQLSDWLSLIGTVVLVITLLLLVWQTVLNKKLIQASQYLTGLSLMFEWRSDVMKNPALAEPYKDDPYFAHVLNEHGVERYFHTLKIIHILEVYFMLNQQGLIEKTLWDAWESNADVIMRPKKNRELWGELKRIKIYDRKFVDFVDSLIERNLARLDASDARAPSG